MPSKFSHNRQAVATMCLFLVVISKLAYNSREPFQDRKVHAQVRVHVKVTLRSRKIYALAQVICSEVNRNYLRGSLTPAGSKSRGTRPEQMSLISLRIPAHLFRFLVAFDIPSLPARLYQFNLPAQRQPRIDLSSDAPAREARTHLHQAPPNRISTLIQYSRAWELHLDLDAETGDFASVTELCPNEVRRHFRIAFLLTASDRLSTCHGGPYRE